MFKSFFVAADVKFPQWTFCALWLFRIYSVTTWCLWTAFGTYYVAFFLQVPRKTKIQGRGYVASSENGLRLSMVHSDCRGTRNAHAVRGRGTRDKSSRWPPLSWLVPSSTLCRPATWRKSIPIRPRLTQPLPPWIHIQNPLTRNGIVCERRFECPRDSSLP